MLLILSSKHTPENYCIPSEKEDGQKNPLQKGLFILQLKRYQFCTLLIRCTLLDRRGHCGGSCAFGTMRAALQEPHIILKRVIRPVASVVILEIQNGQPSNHSNMSKDSLFNSDWDLEDTLSERVPEHHLPVQYFSDSWHR